MNVDADREVAAVPHPVGAELVVHDKAGAAGERAARLAAEAQLGTLGLAEEHLHDAANPADQGAHGLQLEPVVGGPSLGLVASVAQRAAVLRVRRQVHPADVGVHAGLAAAVGAPYLIRTHIGGEDLGAGRYGGEGVGDVVAQRGDAFEVLVADRQRVDRALTLVHLAVPLTGCRAAHRVGGGRGLVV